METGFMIGIVFTLALVDLIWRQCPNWISLPLIAGGIVAYGAPAVWTVVGVMVVLEVAKFPAGDVKGAGAMAAWVPWWMMVGGLILAMIATLVLMETRWYKLYQWAHRWPWLAGLACGLTISGICGTLFFT